MTAERLDEERGGGSRSVIDRAFAIIGTFQGGRVRQSLSDISRHAGLPIATCYRIVQRLTEWGALERDSEGKYRIGLRLWEVASLAPRAVGLKRIARPYLQDLYETTGYASHLAIREGTEMVSIERFQSPSQSPRRPRAGHRYQLHVSAIGQVLLAHATAEVQEEILSSELRAYTEYTYTERKELERVLADIRLRGYAISDRQADLIHVGVAAPIFAPDKSVVAALSLALTHIDADGKNIIHLVRIAANGISRALREGSPAVAVYDFPSR